MQLDTIVQADALEFMRGLEDESVDCVVTSPPYWGLRDYNVDGQIGLEDTPQAFVQRMVELFREVRRVLRNNGTCWINLGDSYSSGGRTTQVTQTLRNGQTGTNTRPPVVDGLKPKDLCGIPWRVAFGLQDDGWYLRSAAPWVKGSAMPESVTDRATNAHEYVFQFSKSAKYWFDADAVRKGAVSGTDLGLLRGLNAGRDDKVAWHAQSIKKRQDAGIDSRTAGNGNRNRRTSDTFYEHMDAQIAHWQYIRANGGALVGDDTIDALLVNPKGYDAAHFASYPMALIDPCVKAGCPPKVCVECGMPWERVTEIERTNYKSYDHPLRTGNVMSGGVGKNFPDTKVTQIGWQSTCECNAETRPGIVLDPFMGAGTTALVAIQNDRHYIGSELNPEYVELARQRIAEFDPFQPVTHDNGATQLSLFSEVKE